MSSKHKTRTCQLLDAEGVGEILSLSKRQVFRLNSCGKIPAPIRIGGSLRWIEGDIIEFIEAMRGESR